MGHPIQVAVSQSQVETRAWSEMSACGMQQRLDALCTTVVESYTYPLALWKEAYRRRFGAERGGDRREDGPGDP